LNLEKAENIVSNNNYGYNINLNNFESNIILNINKIKNEEYSSMWDKIEIEEYKNSENSISFTK
jgi:hypothetical protein